MEQVQNKTKKEQSITIGHNWGSEKNVDSFISKEISYFILEKNFFYLTKDNFKIYPE